MAIYSQTMYFGHLINDSPAWIVWTLQSNLIIIITYHFLKQRHKIWLLCTHKKRQFFSKPLPKLGNTCIWLNLQGLNLLTVKYEMISPWITTPIWKISIMIKLHKVVNAKKGAIKSYEYMYVCMVNHFIATESLLAKLIPGCQTYECMEISFLTE